MLNPLRSLEKKYVAAVLENFTTADFYLEQFFPRKTEALPEQALLDVFTDGASTLKLKYRAAHSLINKEPTRLVPAILEFVNDIVDSDFDIKEGNETGEGITEFQYLLGYLNTPEAYEGVKKFLHRLLTEDLKHKDIFIDGTIISLTDMSVVLKRRDAIPLIKLAMFHFVYPPNEGLISIAESFWAMNEPSLLKHILTEHVTNEMPDVEEVCLEFLEEFNPEFVKECGTEKETANIKNKESS